MEEEEIKESIRELLYDLERTKTNKEIYNVIQIYIQSYPDRDWERINSKFKPALDAERIMNKWAMTDITIN